MRTPELWTPPRVPFTAADVGRSAHVLERAVRDGRIVRLRRGVFVKADAVPSDPAGRHVLAALAVQRVRPHAIASDETAAVASGILLADPRPPQTPTFCSSPGPGRRSTADPRIRVRPLPPHHVTRIGALTCTAVARTGVDVAARVDLPGALVTLDSAARLLASHMCGDPRCPTPRVVRAVAEQLSDAAELALPAHLIGKVNEAITLTDLRRESATESLSAGWFHLAGLPAPIPQFRIVTEAGTYYADFAWPEHAVIGEADGVGKYLTDARSVTAERRRQESLERQGWSVVRWLYRDIAERPDGVISRVSRLLDSAPARHYGN